MPCDSIRTTDVKFGPNTDPDMMLAAMTTLGLSPVKQGDVIYFRGGQYHTKTHTLTLQEYGRDSVEDRTAKMKQAYSGEVVKSQAKRFGWKIQQTGEFEYEVTKRSY